MATMRRAIRSSPTIIITISTTTRSTCNRGSLFGSKPVDLPLEPVQGFLLLAHRVLVVIPILSRACLLFSALRKLLFKESIFLLEILVLHVELLNG